MECSFIYFDPWVNRFQADPRVCNNGRFARAPRYFLVSPTGLREHCRNSAVLQATRLPLQSGSQRSEDTSRRSEVGTRLPNNQTTGLRDQAKVGTDRELVTGEWAPDRLLFCCERN